jgi:HEAT repeat protein
LRVKNPRRLEPELSNESASRQEAPPDAAPAADWFRELSRTLKIARMYRPDSPVPTQARERLARALAEHLARFGVWTFRVTPTEIRLGDHAVVRPSAHDAQESASSGLLEKLPFLFYRDGIRELTFLPEIPAQDVDALVDALALAWSNPTGADDLVTALWQANPTHIQFEALPLEQLVYLSSDSAGAGGAQAGAGLSFGLAPEAREIRGELGQASGPLGLHVEEADLDPVPVEAVDVASAYDELFPLRDVDVARLQAEWDRQAAEDGRSSAMRVLRRMLTEDPSEEMRAAAAHLVATWIASALERSAWEEAREALDIRRLIDPAGSLATDELAEAVTAIAEESLGDALDETIPEEQARFFALLVGLGPPGVPLALAVLGGARQARTRAAAATALSYLCPEEPELLAAAVADRRPALVRDVVLVLGQIGGPGVGPLLAAAACHPDPSVRREVANALPAVPTAERTDILLQLLSGADAKLMPSLLRVVRLERNPRLARALLELIAAPDLESRGEDGVFALFQALADAGGEDAVPELEVLLLRGGWFGRPGSRRIAAARTLARMGGEQARAALEEGLHSRNAGVRAACREALERQEAA